MQQHLKAHTRPTLTGAELRARRKAEGLSQIALASLAGVSRHTVQYWEAKAVVPTRYGAPHRFCEVLKLQGFGTTNARARIWGLTRPDPQQEQIDDAVAVQMARWREREAVRAARAQVSCGAQTRKGQPCRRLSEPGRRRCKFHGGLSTGPKTPEGRVRIAQAQQNRWAAWKAKKAPKPLP